MRTDFDEPSYGWRCGQSQVDKSLSGKSLLQAKLQGSDAKSASLGGPGLYGLAVFSAFPADLLLSRTGKGQTKSRRNAAAFREGLLFNCELFSEAALRSILAGSTK